MRQSQFGPALRAGPLGSSETIGGRNMHYGSTTIGTDWNPPDWRERLLKKALFFIPAANPHSEPLFPKVTKWLLAVDDDGTPLREVGLDADGSALFRMPDGQDYGFGTDSNVSITIENLTPITAGEFEEAWKKAKEPIQITTDNSGAPPLRV